jgi:Xaa-Pro aminopeptidase
LRRHSAIAHGIGLVHHEDPVVHRDSTAVLETGMVLSLEMEFRHAEAGQVKIEDMVVMTPAGGEILSPDGRSWYLADG